MAGRVSEVSAARGDLSVAPAEPEPVYARVKKTATVTALPAEADADVDRTATLKPRDGGVPDAAIPLFEASSPVLDRL